MSRIIFNLAAKCDRAGRSQNQDNYWVCPDLTKWDAPLEKIVGTDEDVELSDKGALLVVADGMGGMNAGEVASKLVIEGIKKKFSNIPDSILTNEAEISSFIHSAIVESDESIKQYAKEHKDAEGLGSTIVLLWLLNGRAFCGWCGDSRIYRFNPNNELVRLSHDHSYVQSLVDEGKITEEEAFDHPDSNIISKALGDNGNKAEPEIRAYDIYSRDVFMLCSDGLCGLLQDSELNEIISRDCTSSKETLKSLWNEGEKAGWSDNATIDVLCVVDGGKPAKGRPDGYPIIAKKPVERKNQNKPQVVSGGENVFAKILKPPYLYLLAFVALLLLCLALLKTLGSKDSNENTNMIFNTDTTRVNQDVEIGNPNPSPDPQPTTPSKPSQQKPPKTTGPANNGVLPGGSTTSTNVLQGQEGEGQSGSGIPGGITDRFKPSKAFMEAYDRVRPQFRKANPTVVEINKKGYMTISERKILIQYTKAWENNEEILEKEMDRATEQKNDIMQFKSLYGDVVQKLNNPRRWPVEQNEYQSNPDNGPDYHGGVYLDM